MPDPNEEQKEINVGLDKAIFASLIFWASSFLSYLGTQSTITSLPLIRSLAQISLLIMALIGLIGSLAYLAVWPITHGWLRPKARTIVVYVAGLVLGFVLWELLRLDQHVAYLELLGTLTVAAIIGLIVDDRTGS